MQLHPETQTILRLVEEKTRRPVLVQPDTAMQALASVTMARDGTASHLVRFRPDLAGVDYIVAYQCGFILRQYENAPEERFDFVAEASGMASVRHLLVGPGGSLAHMKLPEGAVDRVARQFFDGLMTQLRSVPIGMRIDAWLDEEYPGLREEQVASFTAKHRDNAQSLEPEVRDMVPPPVFNANAAMNAAYAIFCDRLLGQTLFTVPYRAAGMEERGRDLLLLWDNAPPEAAYDRELVDEWGEDLGLTDWYRWQPMAAEDTGTDSTQE